MAKKEKNIIEEQIERFVRYYDSKGNEYKDEPLDSDDVEFSYGEFLEQEFGVTVSDGITRIDLRSMAEGLKKYESVINDPKYLEVELTVYSYDGYFEDADLVGKREENDEDVRQRQLEKERAKEEEKRAKEERKQERERKKLEKLRKQLEKYKDKL